MENRHHVTEPLPVHAHNPHPERIAPVSEASLAQSRRLAALAGSVRGPVELCRGEALTARGLAEAACQAAERATDDDHELWLLPVLALLRQGHALWQTMRDIRAGSGASACWFLLESTDAELLASLVQAEGLLAWSELVGDPSIALIVAHDGPPLARGSGGSLRMRHSIRVPDASVADVMAWCRKRQPAIEAWLGMAVEQSALEVAVRAATTSPWDDWGFSFFDEAQLARAAEPEHVMSVLSASAAMLRFEWRCGPVRLAHLERRSTMDQQAEVVALARGETPQQVLDPEASMEHSALEGEWREGPSELVLDQAAVMSWLEGRSPASSASDAFWYDARCLNKEVTRE
ncbi:hypothetical protein ACMDCT_06580 [Halomonadaceae bacterium KBTZ08]